ncbi:DUF5079 family protein [Staphylococcus caeli]|uniref:Membrane protein n=1 Tax=Staphylococcus caeli TaxID=2201815 RepID=A0A1D4JYL4_9STAP|nr:DUF5079 family protein [Staphylococcus caeli]SCS66839.1 membrane protein [Staphylococcus caeli]SCS86049.1 membrane protein [Staphylococcus caeli]
MYIYVFVLFWILINIIYFIQERNEKFKTNRSSVIRYLIINILCGYSIPTAMASIYVFGATVNGFEVFNYWILIVVAMFLSWLGLHLILCNEFEIVQNTNGNLSKIIGVALKILAIGILIYLKVVVPSTQDENKFIWLSIIPIIAIDVFLGRSYFNYALFCNEEKEVNSSSLKE